VSSPEDKQQAGLIRNDVKFNGFDGRKEGEHYRIMRFLIDELGRFPEFDLRMMAQQQLHHDHRV
jgi:uncharacterized protein YfbU (UPF0304 family)